MYIKHLRSSTYNSCLQLQDSFWLLGLAWPVTRLTESKLGCWALDVSGIMSHDGSFGCMVMDSRGFKSFFLTRHDKADTCKVTCTHTQRYYRLNIHRCHTSRNIQTFSPLLGFQSLILTEETLLLLPPTIWHAATVPFQNDLNMTRVWFKQIDL